jgi:hypothetical protein
MKRAGVRGRPARVWIDGESLRIDGAKAGSMRLPLDGIQRVRVGYYEGKYGKSFRTVLWVEGGKRPLELQPMKPYGDYSAVVRRLARIVADARGLAAVERGTELSLALFNALVLTGGFVALCVVMLLDPESWPLLLLAIAFGGLALYALREMRRKHLPRPVSSLAELDVQLPE